MPRRVLFLDFDGVLNSTQHFIRTHRLESSSEFCPVAVSNLCYVLEIPVSDRHAVAAMLLHEQPFGFTRKDVELLRALSESEQVLALAGRIEALLP